MSRIITILKEKSPSVIVVFHHQFTTRQIIGKLAYEHQVDYVELLLEAYNHKNENPQIFLNLHSQIGRYLLNNAEDLGIKKIEAVKEPDINPFGRETSTQSWEKCQRKKDVQNNY